MHTRDNIQAVIMKTQSQILILKEAGLMVCQLSLNGKKEICLEDHTSLMYHRPPTCSPSYLGEEIISVT